MPVPSDPGDYVNDVTEASADTFNNRFGPLYETLDGGDVGIDGDNLNPAFAAQLGVSDSSAVRRGKVINTAEESRTSASYGSLPTPDRVSDVAVSAGGLLLISYEAMWKHGAAFDGAKAAIFIDGVQLQAYVNSNNAPAPLYAGYPVETGGYLQLFSSPWGLVSGYPEGGAGQQYETPVTTGVIPGFVPIDSDGGDPDVSDPNSYSGAREYIDAYFGTIVGAVPTIGGPCVVTGLPDGEYDVEVRYKNDGTHAVYAKNRVLRVWTMDF